MIDLSVLASSPKAGVLLYFSRSCGVTLGFSSACTNGLSSWLSFFYIGLGLGCTGSSELELDKSLYFHGYTFGFFSSLSLLMTSNLLSIIAQLASKCFHCVSLKSSMIGRRSPLISCTTSLSNLSFSSISLHTHLCLARRLLSRFNFTSSQLESLGASNLSILDDLHDLLTFTGHVSLLLLRATYF